MKKFGGVVPCACPGVKSSVDASATAQNSCPRIEHPIGGDEHLRRRRRRDVRQSNVEILHETDIRIREWCSSSFQQQYGVVPGERGGEGASRRASAHNYVVVGGGGSAGQRGGGRVR